VCEETDLLLLTAFHDILIQPFENKTHGYRTSELQPGSGSNHRLGHLAEDAQLFHQEGEPNTKIRSSYSKYGIA
jgi:hypothetical protein